MAVEQPQSGDTLNSPDHAALHRVIAASTSANVQSIAVYDDSTVRTPEMVVMSNVSGKAIQVDVVNPTYTWRDLVGAITTPGGGTAPTFPEFRTNINAWRFNDDGDEVWINFHMPHDYIEGTEIYIHTHWGLDVANSTDSLT